MSSEIMSGVSKLMLNRRPDHASYGIGSCGRPTVLVGMPREILDKQNLWFRKILKEFWRLQLLHGLRSSPKPIPCFVRIALSWVLGICVLDEDPLVIRRKLIALFPDMIVSASELSAVKSRRREMIRKYILPNPIPKGVMGNPLVGVEYYEDTFPDREYFTCMPTVMIFAMNRKA